MSYILDALKKSDQERQRGTLPGMHSLRTTPGPGRRSWGKWPILLATILFVGAGFLAWWRIGPMSGRQTEISATQVPADLSAGNNAGVGTAQTVKPVGQPLNPTASAGEQPSPKTGDPKTRGNSPEHSPGVAPAPTPEAFPGPRVARARGEAARKPAAKLSSPAGTVEPGGRNQRPSGQAVASQKPALDSSTRILAEMENAAAGVIGKSAGTATGDAPETGQTGSPGELPAPVPGAPVPAPPTPTRGRDTKVPTTDAAQTAARPPKGTTLPQDAQESPPTTAGKPKNTIPELRELPSTVQSEIPSMSFSMLVYSEVPGDRMIRINGKLLREGDEVASGLKLEEIVPGGAVFSFRGQRFKKGVL